VDGRIAALAARQHGVVAARQLKALGLARQTIADRVATGRLHRVHRGVYAVGHPVLGGHGRWMAAVLACGPRAALSHASAGALWGVRPNAARRPDVSVPRSGGERPGLRVHRARSLSPDEVTTHRGIPVTTPARTVLDLARPRTPLPEDLPRPRSPHPARQPAHRAGRLDFLFPAQRLIVEAASWTYHRTRRRFERDRRRDAAHTLAGYRTLRFTDRDLENAPHTIAQTLRTALGEQRAASSQGP